MQSEESSTDLLAPTPAASLTESISLAVDFYNRYPGEDICYFARFQSPSADGASIQLVFPRVLQVLSYHVQGEETLPPLFFSETDDYLVAVLNLQAPFVQGKEYTLEIKAQINTFQMDQHILAEAWLLDGDKNPLAQSEIQVAVRAKGQYLRYLPEIYQTDDFTSRFLMLIESFWKPISTQIGQISNYFDPNLMPPEFLPWISSWMGLTTEMDLPDDRMRKLLRQGVSLFQSRGTLNALKTHLEIITAGKVHIREQRAANFSLGNNSSLGVSIALGRKNQPNTVMIHVEAPESELKRLNYSEEMYHRKIKSIITALVPAHVFFDLECSYIPAPIEE